MPKCTRPSTRGRKSAADRPFRSPPWVADLHIHSKYSRACSRDLELENLAWWAQRKGITLLGTGDFTHPGWFDHLRSNLVPAEPGLYRLAPDARRRSPAGCRPAMHAPVRFMLSVEISTIYKRDDRTRKVHHLIYLPDLEAVARFNSRLGHGPGGLGGNLGSDGRPILGLDSRDLLEITLEASPDGFLVPAHIWTPWFSALGSAVRLRRDRRLLRRSGRAHPRGRDRAELRPGDELAGVQPGRLPAGVQFGRSLAAGAGPRGDRPHRRAVLSRRSGGPWRPATVCTGRSSSSRRRASTTRTATGPAACAGSRPGPGRPAVAAPSAASR